MLHVCVFVCVHQVRAIPLQLQRLFARLLLLNQSSAEVTALTDSFGWTNSEVCIRKCSGSRYVHVLRYDVCMCMIWVRSLKVKVIAIVYIVNY